LGREGLIPTTDQFGTALGDIFRCCSCGHMQLQPMPSEELLAAAYADAASDDYVDEEAGQRETARRTLAAIESAAPGRGRLLDLGCWVGFLLAEARLRGWTPLGVEPSEFGHAYATHELDLEVLRAGIMDAPLPAAGFEAVAMGDVIEHLPDPGAALVRIRELLVPGGVLWLALPDAGSQLARLLGRRWWSVIPTHVQYFTRGSVGELLRRHGFEVIEMKTSPKAFTVGYYLSRIGGYSPRLGSLLVAVARRLGLAERMWAPDFHDRMYVIARRS
jgi:SAM-dependent methyltransferase